MSPLHCIKTISIMALQMFSIAGSAIRSAIINIHIQKMRKPLVTLFLCVLLVLGTARRHREAPDQPTQAQRLTVADSNHFSSQDQKVYTGTLSEIQADKAVVFYLKPGANQNSADQTLSNNPVTVTIGSTTCNFDNYKELCYLSSVATKEVELKVECKQAPCDVSWMVLQPPVHTSGQPAIDQLMTMSQGQRHAVLEVRCDNPELQKTFADSLNLYTDSTYEKFVTKVGLVVFLFKNEKSGGYFLTTTDEKASKCANASLRRPDSQVQFNQADTIQYDYVAEADPAVYELPAPQHDFRVDFSAHDAAMQVLTNSTGIMIHLSGIKDGKEQILRDIPLSADNKEPFLDFSIVFKKPTQSYDKLHLVISGSGRTLIVQSSFSEGDPQQVELGEESYFDLKKGEKINYKLVPISKNVENIETIYIFPEGNGLKSSQSACSKDGCQFTIEASEDGKGSIYLGETAKKQKAREEVIVEQFKKRITKKAKQGQELFYSYKISADKSIQLLVNTPNVVIYVASQAKCKQVDEKDCYEKVFTHIFPTIYTPKQNGTLLFKVIVLDRTQFTITVIEQGMSHISLKDSIPMSYLMDDREQSLLLSFKNSNKKQVSFNLIGPVNELTLSVINEDDPKKMADSEHRISPQGYILFKADQIKNERFTIMVTKNKRYKQKYVHFTIIASTKESNFRLEAGSAHYETIPAQNTVDYVFEFEPGKESLLNFYTHNQHTIDIEMTVNNADEYDKAEKAKKFIIDSQTDVLDLGLVEQELCKEQQQDECELFVRLKNKMEVELDLTVTLIQKDSIIELKDGIWQGYSATEISATSHFWFSPKHQNHSTTIFYKSTLPDLRINYKVWHSDDQSINPAEWPFPLEFKKDSTPELGFKPLHLIHIEPKELSKCWPNCLVLLSIIPSQEKQTDKNDVKQEDLLTQKHQFKIMASNNYIELPEKHKVDLTMGKGEEKEFLVDLKYFLDKQYLVFNTYQSLGKTTFKLNVHSEVNPRCPNNQDEADFTLQPLETAIAVKDIQEKISQNSMEGQPSLYLCILAQSDDVAKFSIDFTADTDGVRQLALDSSHPLSLDKSETRLFHLPIDSEFYLKFTRDEGFPYINTKVCNKKDMEECITKFTQSDQKGHQMSEKMYEVQQKPCSDCMLMIKVSSEEPSKVTIHPTSKYGEFDLVENHALSDILNSEEENRYQITGNQNEEIIINFQVQSGNIKVQVRDFSKVDVTKTSKHKAFRVVIPPEDLQAKEQQLGKDHAGSFSHSSFRHLHVIVTSQDSGKNASYTISHSSGESVLFLQDGLITEFKLDAKKPTKFIYTNPTISKIYLHLSAPDAASLGKIKTEIVGMNDLQDEDEALGMTPEKADFGRKTPNPTQLMQLPAKKNYIFTLTNKADSDVRIFIGVNNRQIIYLPFDHQFPVQLGMGEIVYVVVPCPNPGYLHITLKKCDMSQPYLGYTFDHSQFVEEDFDIEQQITDDLTYDLVLKVKPGNKELYLKVRSHVGEKSVLTLSVAFSPTKISAERPKAGGKGLIQYQLLDSTKAELTFTSLVCAGGHANCNKEFSYQALSSNGQQNVIAQLVCTSVAFDLPEIQQLKAPKASPIPAASSTPDHKVTFTEEISGDINYVGVKAVSKSTGEIVYYRPVEIVTLWGEIQRSKISTLVIVTILICIFSTLGLIVYRRFNRQSYYPVLNDNIE